MSEQAAQDLRKGYEEIRQLLRRDIVGLDEVIRLLLTGIFSNGHCLLIGVPGLAKTRLIATLSRLLEMDFSRIQFTPDLMPNDITGAEVIVEDKITGERQFEFMKGPIFANIILADEINRTPPKTQASLMEAMEERQVTSLGKRFDLDLPFFVLATQNPIEQEGTYPLPAAQLDRFFFSINVDYPSLNDEAAIVRMATRPEMPAPKPVLSKTQVMAIMEDVQHGKVPEEVARYATTLSRRSRPDDENAPAIVKKYVSYGAGPRASQALVMGAKVLAMLRGESVPTCQDVRDLVAPVLRHRVVMNFLGAAENRAVEDILERLVIEVPAPDRPAGFEEEKKGGLFSFFKRRAE